MSIILALAACALGQSVEWLGTPTPAGAVARLGDPDTRSMANAGTPVISPDGRWILGLDTVALRDPWRGLRDATTGRAAPYSLDIPRYDDELRFTEDGRLARIVVIGGRGEVAVFDVSTGKLLRSLPLNAQTRIASSRSGRVAAAPRGNFELARITVHDLNSTKPVAEWEAPLVRESLFALSSDGKWLATTAASRSGIGNVEIRVWDAERGKLAGSLPPSRERATHAVFGSDGKTLFLLAGTKVESWDWRAKRVTRTFAVGSDAESLHLSPDGKTLVALSRVQGSRLWNLSTGEFADAEGVHGRPFTSVGFRADGRVLGCERHHESFALRDLRTGRVFTPPAGPRHLISDIRFDSRSRVASVDEKGWVVVWDWPGGISRTRRLTDADQLYRRGRGAVRWLRFSPGSENVVVFQRQGEAVYRRADGRRLFETNHGFDLFEGLRPSFLGESELVSFSPIIDPRHVRLLGLPSGKPAATVPVPLPEVPGWKASLVAYDSTRWPRPLLAVGVNSMAVRDDQERDAFRAEVMVLGLDGKPLAWRKPFRQDPGQFTTGGLRFSPCGRRLLVAFGEQPLRILDVFTGRLRQAFTVPGLHDGLPVFSPSGTQVAALGRPDRWEDARVEVWEADTGKRLIALPQSDSPITALAFSPCGRYLASGDKVGVILVWDLAYTYRESTATSLTDLWAGLATSDATAALAAMGGLTRSPREATKLFRERLRPAVRRLAPEPGLAKRLVARLDSDSFTEREKARVELQALGEWAEPAMRAALTDSPSLELRKRLSELLGALENRPLSRDELRALRAVTVLGWIATDEAHALLRELSGGDADAPLTWAAGAALRSGVEGKRAK